MFIHHQQLLVGNRLYTLVGWIVINLIGFYICLLHSTMTNLHQLLVFLYILTSFCKKHYFSLLCVVKVPQDAVLCLFQQTNAAVFGEFIKGCFMPNHHLASS